MPTDFAGVLKLVIVASIAWFCCVWASIHTAVYFAERRRYSLARAFATLGSILQLRPGLSWYLLINGACRGTDTRRVRGLCEAALQSNPTDWLVANMIINGLIFCGAYREALAVEARFTPPERNDGARSLFVLAQINLAEANYNLGDWAKAAARIDEVSAEAEGDALNRNVLRIQKAWIAANLGDGERALEELDGVRLPAVPVPYHAEYYLTRALALLVARNVDEGTEFAERGILNAVRASSRRNAEYLLARILAARGLTDKALAAFERGFLNDYTGQGGDGLLAYGDLLERLGDHEKARSMWRTAIERDPESVSARDAQQRLANVSLPSDNSLPI